MGKIFYFLAEFFRVLMWVVFLFAFVRRSWRRLAVEYYLVEFEVYGIFVGNKVYLVLSVFFYSGLVGSFNLVVLG